MARRQISPIRVPRAEADPRDAMIRKLKEDLIVARGREKELVILENFMLELIEKTKLLTAETAKSDEEGKLKLELTVKSLNELKREVDTLRAELRSVTNELAAVESQEAQIKRLLNAKSIEVEKLKREGISLHEENDKLINQQYRLKAQSDEAYHEIKKLSETIRNYEGRLSEINRKIMQVKAYINEVSEENAILKEKLKNYEYKNSGIDNDIGEKENNIDHLEKVFGDKHEIIKNQVENYIELEHLNEKNIKEAKHKANLLRIEGEKGNQIALAIKKLQKNVGDCNRELAGVQGQCAEIGKINEDFVNQNTKLKQDLLFCQQHLENLMRHNAYIQEEMENFLRQDQAIIATIRRKRLIPITNTYGSLRTSRNEPKLSARTYQ